MLVLAQSPVATQVTQFFTDLPVGIIRALDNNPLTDIHCTLDWFRLLAKTALEPDVALRIYWVALPDGQSPLFIPCLAVNQGYRLTALSNFYTPLFAPVDNIGVTNANLQCWVQRITTERWSVVDLRPLDVDATFFRGLLAKLREAGWWVDHYFCFGNWALDVGGCRFAEYFARRSSRMRNTVIRARRRLAKISGFQLEIVQKPGPALEAAIIDYQTVYARSWKKPEPFPDFIPGLCRLAADRGWLRLGLVRIEKRPVAAQLWLCDGRTTSIVKLAHEEALAKLGAGSVLTAALMEHALDVDRVQTVDYLIGDDAYKREWMSHRRERRGIIAFNPRTLGGMTGAVRHFGGRLWRRLRPPTPLSPGEGSFCTDSKLC